MKYPKTERYLAVNILQQVIVERHSLSAALPEGLKNCNPGRDRAFIQALCYGVMREYPRLVYVATQLLKKPFKKKDSDIEVLLLLGIYQLSHMKVPAHAAISETVETAKALKKPWAAAVINASLRRLVREKETLCKSENDSIEFSYSHPRWMYDMLKNSWPHYWERILKENQAHPPMSLRVNQLKCSRDEYLALLDEADKQAYPLEKTTHGIFLEKPCDVKALPKFNEGYVSVQDGACQLAAGLLDLKPDLRVLDACAAPGGKLTHIYETMPTLKRLVGLEIEPRRLDRIHENCQRLGVKADVLEGDVLDPEVWWDSEVFDRILLDAPCSATGVIRRHPDIKYLRQSEDIPQLAATQAAMLEALWPLLADDGLLVYSTCSIFEAENTYIIKDFLAEHPDAIHESLSSVAWGVNSHVGRQLLPGLDDMDGFYYAVIRKCISC